MKFSAISIALCALPVVLGGLIAEPIAARSDHESKQQNDQQNGQQNGHQSGNMIQVEQGNHATIVEEIIILWVNNGGGAATSVVNAASSVQQGAPPATHTVEVGGSAGLVYVPDTISAAVGDSVVFVFNSQNHTVTQSTFDTPCKKLAGGFDSDFVANINNTISPAPMMAMQVTVATPLWFYCRQSGHCGKGMTFSINPTAAKSQADFMQMAIAQNGTGTAANIVGGTTSVGSVATATAATAAASTDTSTNTGSGMATGSGSAGAGGECSCSCFCGVSSFPLAAQGVGAFGGMSGSLPMAALMS